MKHLLLALLAKEPIHGYELKARADEALGRLWPPLNDGQVYVTLRRLERDGLVTSETIEQSDRPSKRRYQLTGQGTEDLRTWLDQIDVDQRLRDGFFMQLVAALHVPGGPDPIGLVARQRNALLRRIREVQPLEREATTVTERLALERHLVHLQADLRWLERCEVELAEGGDR